MFFCRFVQWYIYCKPVFCYLFIALSNKSPGLCSIYALSMYSDGGWVSWLCLSSSTTIGIQVPQTKCSYLDWIVTECGIDCWIVVLSFSRIFCSHKIISNEGLQCNTFPPCFWPLRSEGSFKCSTHCDTERSSPKTRYIYSFCRAFCNGNIFLANLSQSHRSRKTIFQYMFLYLNFLH